MPRHKDPNTGCAPGEAETAPESDRARPVQSGNPRGDRGGLRGTSSPVHPVEGEALSKALYREEGLGRYIEFDLLGRPESYETDRSILLDLGYRLWRPTEESEKRPLFREIEIENADHGNGKQTHTFSGELRYGALMRGALYANGDPSGTRTPDSLLKRQELYH